MVSLALAIAGVGLALLICYWVALTRRDVRTISAQVALMNIRTAEMAEQLENLDTDLRKVVDEQ